MHYGLRWDGAGEDVDGDWPPTDERINGDDDGDDFPLPEGSFPGRTTPPEPYIGSAKVPPRGGRVSSEKMAYDYFPIERVHIAEDGHRRTNRGRAQGGRARLPPSWAGCGPPGLFLSFRNCYKSQNVVSWSFRTFGVVQNRFQTFAPFPAQNPSCRHSPSSYKPCKIRENSRKYWYNV